MKGTSVFFILLLIFVPLLQSATSQNGMIFRPDPCLAPMRSPMLDTRSSEVKLAECRIEEKNNQLKRDGLDLGQPLTNVIQSPISGVYYREFQIGAIYFIPNKGTFEIHSDFWNKYRALNRETGILGLLEVNTRTLPSGLAQNFERGILIWSQNTGIHMLRMSPIWDAYARLGFETGYLGFPISDERELNAHCSMAYFERGTIFDADGKTHVIKLGPILDKWNSLQGPGNRAALYCPTAAYDIGFKYRVWYRTVFSTFDGTYFPFQQGIIYSFPR
jgi:uncharacterized protein with LGFP repeats